jgi:hypothetical protein
MTGDIQKAAADLIDRSKRDDEMIVGSEIRAVVSGLQNRIAELEKEIEIMASWKQVIEGVESDSGAIALWMTRAQVAEERVRDLEDAIRRMV